MTNFTESAPEEFKHLLSPLKIGNKTVRNRILVSAHVPGFAEQNKPGEKYIAYHQTYAKAGVGLQVTGGTPVHESGLLSITSDGLWNLDDSIIPGYQALSTAVQAEGGVILAQLAHSAGTVLINQPGRESWAPSPVRSLTTGNIAHEMSHAEILEVIAAFEAAAFRVAKGNMDGVEILGAFGFLPQAFLSPLTNWRTDEYGGKLENRLRFLLDVLSVVRKSIGPDRILGIRIPGDEFEPGGLTLADMKIVAKKLETTGLIDYLNIIAHTNFTFTGRAKHWAPTPAPQGMFVNLAAEIKSVVNLPVFAVGRITQPTYAEQVVANGYADMVGMTRAHICDPQIVKKIKSNKLGQIRPCVGANTCIANRYNGKPIRCMHNPNINAINARTSVDSSCKQVIVIGAGPAGLEASRIAAERGHKVILYEKNADLGGQLALWARSKSMRELQKIIDWRESELMRLGVAVNVNRCIDSQQMGEISADVYIIATGALEKTENIPGDRRINQVTPHEILKTKTFAAKSALVWHDGRGQAGLVAAEHLLNHGVRVQMLTSDSALAADLDPTNRVAWMQRLGKHGCQHRVSNIIEATEGNSVIVKDIYSDKTDIVENIDLIVDWRGCTANNTLAQSFQSKDSLITIGDCVAPRNVEVAMSEAANAVAKI